MASSTPVGNTSLTTFDVLVIGSGAGGGAVAGMLATHGKKVLVLEAGPNRFEGLADPVRQPTTTFSNDELKLTVRNFILPDPVVEPRTFRNSVSDGDRTFVGDVNGLPKNVGGGSVHADLKMPRFMPQDFTLGTALGAVSGASFADWPVDYAMLEPFYCWAEAEIGVQGLAGADPFAGPRSKPFPMSPGVGMYGPLTAAAGAQSLGYTPFAYPTAVNSMPYDGRPPCNDCGFCSGWGCPTNAKGSSAVTTLRHALLSGNCLLLPETRAVKLTTNGAGTQITGVVAIGPDGRRHTYVADQYVLAASPIEDARLLLISGGVGNSSDQVGRNLMFHLQTSGVAIFEERMHGHRGRTVTHGISDFRGTPNDPNHPLGGIIELSGSEMPLFEADEIANVFPVLGVPYDGLLFKKLMRQSPFRDRIVAFTMQAEDAPQPTNRVDLDPAVVDLDGLPVSRVTYANHAFELSASAFYAPKLIQIFGAAGARWAFIAPKDPISTSAHIMGTLRMGADPATSVCDATGRFHDVGNLYAGDGSLFPTSSGFNPTLTIIALAARVAAGIIAPGNPDSVLT